MAFVNHRDAVGTSRLRPRLGPENKGVFMLYYVLAFLVLAIIAGVFGFGGIAGTATWVAQVLFVIFLIGLIFSIFVGKRSF